MSDRFLILDVSSAPIADAVSYMEPVSAPANYKDADKIAAYVADKTAERVALLATDIDLAQITGVAYWDTKDDRPNTEAANPAYNWTERDLLELIAGCISRVRSVITYGGHRFDLPLLMRRARYLDIDFPNLNLDRFRSPHIDLCDLLSDREYSRRRPLGFYVRRLGWTDIQKPLSGEEEARVLQTGRWAELEASLYHDVTAVYRLSQWLGIVKPQPKELEPVL